VRLVLIAIWSISLFGCGGSYVSAAKRALYVSAETLRAIDEEYADVYDRAAHSALERSETAQDYKRHMEEYDEAETTIRAVRAALFASEAGLDIYVESGERTHWFASVACLALVFESLFQQLDEITGLGPQSIAPAVSLLKAYGGVCDQPEN